MRSELEHFFSDFLNRSFILRTIDDSFDEGGNLLHFSFFHAASCYRGGSNSNAGRYERTLRVERNGVFIYGDGGPIKRCCRIFTGGFGGG